MRMENLAQILNDFLLNKFIIMNVINLFSSLLLAFLVFDFICILKIIALGSFAYAF